MIKNNFADELVLGMQRELGSPIIKQGMEEIIKAADYLNAAVEIFEDAGMTVKADQVLNILSKIADKHLKPKKVSDHTTKGLTSEKMIKNLLHHGTEFNMSDDNDILNLDINDADLEVKDHSDEDWED
jgi:hypothetical protein